MLRAAQSRVSRPGALRDMTKGIPHGVLGGNKMGSIGFVSGSLQGGQVPQER